MDWATPSQAFFLRKVEEAAAAGGRPLTGRDRDILRHGVLGSFENNSPPEPGFRRRIVRLLDAAFREDLKAYEESTRPWKHFGYPKITWLRNLHIWYPRPVNEIRAAVEQWALGRFGELRIHDHELFGGM